MRNFPNAEALAKALQSANRAAERVAFQCAVFGHELRRHVHTKNDTGCIRCGLSTSPVIINTKRPRLASQRRNAARALRRAAPGIVDNIVFQALTGSFNP